MGKLNIVKTENRQPSENSSDPYSREEVQAHFERQWLENPQQFNPERNSMEAERIDRTWQLLNSHVVVDNKKIVDLGCGFGLLSLKCQFKGASVDAVDIAANALKRLEGKKLTLKQDFLPKTKLEDGAYDVVICTDVIAELSPKVYRFFFSELARLVKKNGFVVCSTSLDIDTVGALNKLIELAETEFTIVDWKLSYHSLYLRLKRLLKWCHLSPLLNWLNQSKSTLLFLEKLTKTFKSENGISHIIFIAQQKSLIPETPEEFKPQERSHKKQVWE